MSESITFTPGNFILIDNMDLRDRPLYSRIELVTGFEIRTTNDYGYPITHRVVLSSLEVGSNLNKRVKYEAPNCRVYRNTSFDKWTTNNNGLIYVEANQDTRRPGHLEPNGRVHYFHLLLADIPDSLTRKAAETLQELVNDTAGLAYILNQRKSAAIQS